MTKYVIGIDPDSDANGVAVYQDGKLVSLRMLPTLDLYDLLLPLSKDIPASVVIHLENVRGNSCSSFAYKPKDSKAVRAKKSEHVGMCKHAQLEVERIAARLGIEVVLHRVSKSWKCPKTGKPFFERVTGWKGKSNEDTRSAAHFGFLGCR